MTDDRAADLPKSRTEQAGADDNLAEAIRQRFAPLGGVDDLEPHPSVAAGASPAWLQKASAGAKERGLDALTPDDIDSEIAAYRREKQGGKT